MSEQKKEPKFSMEFIGFSSMGSIKRVEASIALSPEYDIDMVTDFLYGEDSVRVITLVFKPVEKQFGRKGFSLKKEWETTPQGEVTLDSSNNQKDTFPTPEKQQEILREAIDYAKNQKVTENKK